MTLHLAAFTAAFKKPYAVPLYSRPVLLCICRLVPMWAPPEYACIFLNGGTDYQLDPAVEVFAFGVILGQLLKCGLWPAGLPEDKYLHMLAIGQYQVLVGMHSLHMFASLMLYIPCLSIWMYRKQYHVLVGVHSLHMCAFLMPYIPCLSIWMYRKQYQVLVGVHSLRMYAFLTLICPMLIKIHVLSPALLQIAAPGEHVDFTWRRLSFAAQCWCCCAVANTQALHRPARGP